MAEFVLYYWQVVRKRYIGFHEQQKQAIANADEFDAIVIPDSEDGYPALTWDEVATLQEQQADEIWEWAADSYDPAACFIENGGPGMTVQELKNLHM